jgi:hypothetical protein
LGKYHESELPGEDLITKGLSDLENGVESVESLLVAIGAPRLQRMNISVPAPRYSEYPEERLYRFLETLDPASAYSSYNAYIRRLVSFEHALESLETVPSQPHRQY